MATEIWADYNMTIAEAKTHTNAWGATDIEPILGVVIDPQQRRRRLSQHKVDKYSANIDDVIALAESTKGNLVPKKDMQQILGRLLFAAKAGIPAMRGDFHLILSKLSGHWSRIHLKLGSEARDILRHMQWRLLHTNGCALTAYRARPGEDGARV